MHAHATIATVMVTAHDIARHVGVNQSTVSRVLSGFPHVSARTAEKVQRACKELGYVPNAMARNLSSRRTYAIVVHIPSGEETVVSDPFVAELLIGISRECSAHDYMMILSFIAPDDPDLDLGHLIKSRRADGLILLGMDADDRRLVTVREPPVPCVIAHAKGRLGKLIVSVDMDNRDTGRRAAEFLVGRGHRRIGAILEPKGNLAGNDFRQGMAEVLRSHGLDSGAALVRRIPVAISAARRAAEDLLSGPRPPTALLVNTVLGTFGVLEARRSANRTVEVMGMESSILQDLYPDVPRIRAPVMELGHSMSSVLIRMIETGQALTPPEMLRVSIVDEEGRVC